MAFYLKGILVLVRPIFYTFMITTVSQSPAQLGAMNTNKAAQPARETEMPSKTWKAQ